MLAPGVGFDYVSRMELGVYTFAETTPDPATGKTIGTAQRLRDLLEEIELADQVDLDVYGIGEHHREDFSAAAPPMILSAAAARTKKICPTSAPLRQIWRLQERRISGSS